MFIRYGRLISSKIIARRLLKFGHSLIPQLWKSNFGCLKVLYCQLFIKSKILHEIYTNCKQIFLLKMTSKGTEQTLDVKEEVSELKTGKKQHKLNPAEKKHFLTFEYSESLRILLKQENIDSILKNSRTPEIKRIEYFKVKADSVESDCFYKSVGTQCSGSSEESIIVCTSAWSEGEEDLEKQEEDVQPDVTVEESVEANIQDKDCLGATTGSEKRKASEDIELNKDLKKAKLETKALKAKRPGFTDDRYNETSYYIENGLRKVYPYYFTFTTFTKGRWVGEKILDVFAREFRAHPAEEYERCIKTGSLTVNYEKVEVDYRLKHNDLLANIVHRHEVPVTADPIAIVHMDEDVVVVNKPASIPVHPCGRYRHNTVVFILAKEYHLKNLRTIHRLDRLTSGLLLFGRTPKKARQMEHQIRNRQVQKEYICRVEGEFPDEVVECTEPIEVVSYKIGVCKVSPKGKDCNTTFQKLGYNPETNTSVVLCLPHTGRMHQIRVHLQYLGYPVVNDPLYNHVVFGPEKGRAGNIGKSDEELIRDLISIHNAENWLGMDGDSELSMFKPLLNFDEEEKGSSREPSPCEHSRPLPLPPPLPCPLATKVTVATQTGHEAPDLSFHPDKLTSDPHCYECKVKYRDPKPRDLVMYLHAWKYRGPGWSYQTELPEWARIDWVDTED